MSDTPIPGPPPQTPTAAELQAQAMMWKARAMQNRAETRELQASVTGLRSELQRAKNKLAKIRMQKAQEDTNEH